MYIYIYKFETIILFSKRNWQIRYIRIRGKKKKKLWISVELEEFYDLIPQCEEHEVIFLGMEIDLIWKRNEHG